MRIRLLTILALVWWSAAWRRRGARGDREETGGRPELPRRRSPHLRTAARSTPAGFGRCPDRQGHRHRAGRPSTRMVASSGCTEEECTVRKATGIDGTFEAELVSAEARGARGTIVLGYDDNALVGDRPRNRHDHPPHPPTCPPASPRTTRRPREQLQARPPSRRTATEATASAAPPTATTAPQSGDHGAFDLDVGANLVVIGDSLAVGIKPYLPALLPGWTCRRRPDRPTLSEGMSRLSATAAPRRTNGLRVQPRHQRRPEGLTAVANAVQTSTAKRVRRCGRRSSARRSTG